KSIGLSNRTVAVESIGNPSSRFRESRVNSFWASGPPVVGACRGVSGWVVAGAMKARSLGGGMTPLAGSNSAMAYWEELSGPLGTLGVQAAKNTASPESSRLFIVGTPPQRRRAPAADSEIRRRF